MQVEKDSQDDIEHVLEWEDEETILDKIMQTFEKEAMLKEAEKGNYKPIKINEFGSLYDNFQAYRIANKYHESLENISPEVLSDFAKKTHKKLHIHPIFLLWVLENEIKEKIDIYRSDKDLEYITKEVNHLLKIIPDAMKKVPRPEQIYV